MKQKVLSIACFFVPILAFLPALWLLFLLTHYWVDVLFKDQWRIARFMIHAYTHGLDWNELFSQHHESRKFFPRLFFYALSKLGHWDVRREMLATYVLACGNSLFLLDLIKRTIPLSPFFRWLLLLGMNCFLFSLTQKTNWFWGIQIVCIIPSFFLIFGLWIQQTALSLRTKTAVSVLCATVATFSYSNGMLLWPLLGTSLFFSQANYAREEKWKALSIFGMLAVSMLSVYFLGYQRPVHHTPISLGLANPGKTVHFFFAWCCSYLHFEPSEYPFSVAIGIFLFLLWTFLALATLPKRSNSLPWILLGLYTLISGIACALGRAPMKMNMAFASRYVTFSIYLPLSIMALSVLYFLQHPLKERIVPSIVLVVVLFSLGVYGMTYAKSLQGIKRIHHQRLTGLKAIKEISEHHPHPRRSSLVRKEEKLLHLAPKLLALGLIHVER